MSFHYNILIGLNSKTIYTENPVILNFGIKYFQIYLMIFLVKFINMYLSPSWVFLKQVTLLLFEIL